MIESYSESAKFFMANILGRIFFEKPHVRGKVDGLSIDKPPLTANLPDLPPIHGLMFNVQCKQGWGLWAVGKYCWIMLLHLLFVSCINWPIVLLMMVS